MFISSWLRYSDYRSGKKVSTLSTPIDANMKPKVPKELLNSSNMTALSHHELMESIQTDFSNHRSSTNISATTALSGPAKKGDLKLEFKDTIGFAVGMYIMIGTGSTLEIRMVKGLGSILLDSSIHHSHYKGTLVRGFRSRDDIDEVFH